MIKIADDNIPINFPSSILLIGPQQNLDQVSEKILSSLALPKGDLKVVTTKESEGKTQTISIKQIREAQHFINLTPHGTQKVLVFEQADQMTAEAANALLKTLEEPPRYALNILKSTTRNLLPTILSRCREYNLWQSECIVGAEYHYLEILKMPFYQQSQLIEQIVSELKVEEFLAQFESWARNEMRREAGIKYSRLIKDIISAKRELRRNVNGRIILENLVLKYRL